MIHPARIHLLNDAPPATNARYVLYWMQASQRTRYNHALEHAIHLANERSLPLLVAFGLMDDYPEANARHYAFMLQGLADVAANLAKRHIPFVLRHGHPARVALDLSKHASTVVCDVGYLRHQRAWRDQVADGAGRKVVAVESDVVVPVNEATQKQEIGARTLRPKLHRQWPTHMVPLTQGRLKETTRPKVPAGKELDPSKPDVNLAKLKLDRSVPVSPYFTGGETAAHQRLADFIRHKLPTYAESRNEPAAGHTSTMSAYLHFGQISALEIALAVKDAKAPQADRDAYLEELCVRRELSVNFVYHSPKYDEYACIPEWAKKTLAEQRNDPRPHTYTRQQLEAADTGDAYWNAAQREMNVSGFMHNYMRMYWGKKILEWSPSPQEAYETILYLNNRLFLCGRDPNGYAGVAWTFGQHDRPWGPRRPIFGTVRYMNAAGLKRKFDIDAYVRKTAAL